ncbi:MAG: phage tail sheath subtilisin-like domain-containing protein [Cellvibrio sp.]
MPATLSYPGVYIEEIPSGVRTITSVATSITAFVGRAPSGPVDKPLILNSYGDFERYYGGLHLDFPLSYSVRDFYLNGGSQAVIARLYQPELAEDQSPIEGVATVNVDEFILKAKSPGSWGNKLTATLDTKVDADAAARLGVAAGSSVFNLQVLVNGKVVESYLNLTNDDKNTRYIERVLKNESNLVVFSKKDAAAKTKYDEVAKAVADAQAALKAAEEKKPPVQAEVDAANAALKTARENFDKNANDGKGNDGIALALKTYQGNEAAKEGIYLLEKVDLFNLLVIPPDVSGGDVSTDVLQAAIAYAVKRRAFVIADAPQSWKSAAAGVENFDDLNLSGVDARNAALYFPYVREANPLRKGQVEDFPPSGAIAGIFARTDTTRGVWKAPAGLDASVNGIQGLSVNLTDLENGQLNQLGINSLRAFPGSGKVVWGARTLRGADRLADEWKYVPVRRTALFIEESLYRGTQWVVFEPNDEPLWAQIRLNVGAFLHNLFRLGAFQGSTPKDAYFVKCDKETTTQTDINSGVVNVVVGFAPLKPAEFVVIKLQQIAGQIEV